MFFGYQSSLPDYATLLPRHRQTVEAAPGRASTWQTTWIAARSNIGGDASVCDLVVIMHRHTCHR